MAGEPEKPERPVELQLLDILDQLRDAFHLAIDCAERDIRRMMRNKEQQK